MTALVSVVLVLVIVGILVFMVNPTSSVIPSTIEREPLPSGAVVEAPYYTDELDWISSPAKLTAGMKNFYQRTGVQPHLYITDTIAGSHTPTNSDAEIFLEETYYDLFRDEAHVLIVFFEHEPGEFYRWYWCGAQAKSVLDDEAMNILLDYIDLYYYDQSLSANEEFFSKSFDDASKRIMTVTTSPWIPVLIIFGIVLVLLLLFVWWRKSKQQKNLEDESTRKILETPLDSFGTNEREKKYED